ncbi:MAG: glycosyltransferase [Fervidobacterium sp.]
MSKYENLFTSEKLAEKVKHIPFLQYDKLLDELSYSMFSIISFRNFTDWSQGNLTLSLPNKFFDSMAAGVPVIVSNNFVELCNVVESDNVGIIIDPEKPRESVDKILEYSQKEKYEVFLQNIIKHRHKYIYDDEKKKILRDFVIKIIKESEKRK